MNLKEQKSKLITKAFIKAIREVLHIDKDIEREEAIYLLTKLQKEGKAREVLEIWKKVEKDEVWSL